MKLFLFTGTDDCDIENSLDWFVVADDLEKAKELWKDAVENFRGEAPSETEMDHAFVVLNDVTGTPYEGDARSIPWDEIEDLA